MSKHNIDSIKRLLKDMDDNINGLEVDLAINSDNPIAILRTLNTYLINYNMLKAHSIALKHSVEKNIVHPNQVSLWEQD